MGALNLDMFAYDHAKFSWSLALTRATTEASEVGFNGCYRLYDDAVDEGIAIRGKEGVSTFYLADTQKYEGDIVAWIFKPTSETVRKFPRLKRWEVCIIND